MIKFGLDSFAPNNFQTSIPTLASLMPNVPSPTNFADDFKKIVTSLTKEEASADTDYLLMSASIESEKEIGSFDDIILVMVVLLYVFG